jgi:hypothetical protein
MPPWLRLTAIVAFVPLTLISAVWVRPAPAAEDQGKENPKSPALMFQPPKDWDRMSRGTVLLFDAPGSNRDHNRRIGVVPPSETKGEFRDWFDLVQAPDPVVKVGEVVAAKDPQGNPTLRVTKVVEARRGQRLHRVYHGVRKGNRFALVLYTASDQETFEKHMKDLDALTDSWNFDGEFPKEKSGDLPTR